MYLILAIVIGCILFSRFKLDDISFKEAQKNIDDNIEMQKASHEEFRRKYSSEMLERTYTEDINNDTEFARRIKNEISLKTKLIPTREMILMGMMAESCKIPRKFIDGGISSPYRGNMSEWEFDDYSKKFLLFIKWYNKKLRANGMHQDLLYIKNDSDTRLWYKNKIEYCLSLDRVDNPRFQGAYIWWDARFYTTTLGRIIV